MKSLYGKFLLYTTVIMLFSFLLAFFVVNTYYHQQLKTKNDEKNMEIIKHITSYIESRNDLHLHDYLTTQANVGYKLYLVNNEGKATFFGEKFRLENLPQREIENVLHGNDYHGMRELPKETFVTGFFSDEMANTVGTSFTYQDTTYALFLRPNIKMLFSEVHYLLFGMLIVMAIVSIIAMLFVARKLIQPLSELTIATKKIGAEQFSIQLPTNRGDEIGELAVSFQKMVHKLQQSDQMRKQFINDVSHDFQTPLQNIKGYANLLQDDQTTNEKKTQYVNIIQSETDRLSALTKQLLLLTSLDTLSDNIEFKAFQLDKQINDVLQKHRWLMDEKNISLTAELDPVVIEGNEAYIEKIWENLLSNALKYSLPNGIIDITLKNLGTEVEVTCRDNGIGIAEENIPYLFHRFYRVDNARHTDIEGTGLGLAIVKRVVTLHGGTIDVKSELGKWTTFKVLLPTNQKFPR